MGDAPAVAAYATGDALALARPRAHDVIGGHRDRQQPRAPGSPGIEHTVVDLDCVRAVFQPRGKRLQQVCRHFGIGVDHRNRVRAGVIAAALESGQQRVTLATQRRIEALEHGRACRSRQCRRGVGAVVGDHQDAKAICRPIDAAQIGDRAGDHGRLVVCWYDYVKSKLRLRTRCDRQRGRHQRLYQ